MCGDGEQADTDSRLERLVRQRARGGKEIQMIMYRLVTGCRRLSNTKRSERWGPIGEKVGG